MVGLLLIAISSASVSYVSVRDESFDFMRTPSTITSTAVARGSDPRVARLLLAVAEIPMRVPIAANLRIPLGGHTASDLRGVYFHNYWYDTGNTITVRVRLKSGRTASVVSNSQMPLMLPWVTYGLADPTVTYDAGLSRAIAAFLPKSAPSYALLSGHGDMGWPYPDEPIDLDRAYSAEGLGGICLRAYARDHPGVKMQIHRDGDLSLSFRAQEKFLSDLYHTGDTNAIDTVAGQLQIYTWVTLSSQTARTDWVAGPNNVGTILWRHSGSPLLGADKAPPDRVMDYSPGPCF
jgi:hypothetical protein